MPTDIEIAQAATLRKILPLAQERLGLQEDELVPYGHYKAKLSLQALRRLEKLPQRGKLVLVTAITPTPPGEGKTTTTVGLGDGLNRIGANAIICLREPSLGPCFGMKGGAAGGGHAQVVPMEDINLHFTGDFHAIALANNLLAAMLDNHIHHGNALGLDVRRITWRRVVDMNDRALRQITAALGGPGNGYPREDGFDIVVASEVMAILCLADSLADLKRRLGQIIVGYTTAKKPVTARDLQADGAMAALLKDAIQPNLVQTLEGNPALVHGGPFANIAHGCNSVMATRTALRLADYVVTEAGFGADLGAEKFIDIKCRKSGLTPSCGVVVATIRALKHHGKGSAEGLEALRLGLPNLERHVRNVQQHYRLPAIVSINRFDSDTPEEIALVEVACEAMGVRCVLASHWAEGGRVPRIWPVRWCRPARARHRRWGFCTRTPRLSSRSWRPLRLASTVRTASMLSPPQRSSWTRSRPSATVICPCASPRRSIRSAAMPAAWVRPRAIACVCGSCVCMQAPSSSPRSAATS